MTKITVFVNTSVQFMVGWLTNYTQNASLAELGNGTRRLALQQARQGSRFHDGCLPGGGVLVTQEGIFLKLDKERDVETVYGSFDVIRFELIPLATDRTEIKAKCSHPFAKPYFILLLLEIAKRWPEAQEGLAKWEDLPAIMQKFGVKLPGPKKPKWFPKKEDTLERWRTAWEHICDCQAHALEEYELLKRDEARLYSRDLADYLKREMRWSVSEKTVERIIKAGELGLFKT